MSHDCWYRNAWEALWNSADDYQSATLGELARKAGVLWACRGCGFDNPSDEKKCSGCGYGPSEIVPQVRIDDEDDGTSETDTLDGFCDANPDEAAEVRALSVGGRVTFGGGAAPLITVTRIS